MHARPMRLVITGGTRGFGLALARRMDADGHRVIVASRRGARALPPGGCGGIEAARCDSSDPRQVLELARAASDRMGGIDAWVNNAGLCVRGREDADLGVGVGGGGLGGGTSWMDEALAVVGANAAGVLNGTHCAARAGCGHVFNVYGAGYDGRTEHASGHGVYAASKAFVAFYTRVLARQGVRTHGIVPGIMRTEMLDACCEGLPESTRAALLLMSVDPDDAAEAAARLIVRTVDRNDPGRELDCYSPALARKAWRALTKGRGR